MKVRDTSSTQPHILVIDIETAPILGSVWGMWQQNLGLNQIKHDWYLLSYCAKWLGSKEIIYEDQSQAENIEDDTRLLQGIHELLEKADFVIAHNGKKFDIKKINARMIQLGMPPYSPIHIIDTLLAVRRVAAFTSNKLEFLTDKLCTVKKRKHGKFPGFEMWRECLRGNPQAWREMKLYNIDDVRSLEELYIKLRPWLDGHPNVAAYTPNEAVACDKCGSTHLIRKGFRFTLSGMKYARYQCKGCGGWSRGRRVLSTTEERRALTIS